MFRTWLLILVVACGGTDDGGTDRVAEGCAGCGAGEFCQTIAPPDSTFDDWTEECLPLPDECDEPATCDCADTLYDLCPDGDQVSWACSEFRGSVIITCGYE